MLNGLYKFNKLMVKILRTLSSTLWIEFELAKVVDDGLQVESVSQVNHYVWNV